jgi:hypothetical protein
MDASLFFHPSLLIGFFPMNLKYPFQAGCLLGLLTFVPVRADTTLNYPSASLRGYGTVSGTFTFSTTDGKPGSVLAITCENEDKAKLLLAKFLSDEQTLPGVTKTDFKSGQWGISTLRIGGTDLSAYEAKDQGFFAALRLGAKVLIVASDPRGPGHDG